jgi:hypothetical protein
MKNALVIAACIAFAGLYAFWFFSTHEKVVDERRVGFQGEARYNNFYAAQLLLAELDIESESLPSLVPTEWLPETADTIVVRAAVPLAVGDEMPELDRWVEEGGHLVLLPPDEEMQQIDELLRYFGVSLVEIEREDADENEADDPDTSQDSEEEGEYDYRLNLDGTWYRIEVLYDAQDSATLSDERGLVAFRQPWGDGFVTVLANGYYFSNHELRDSDHARLLMDIVAGWIDPGKVWFIYSTEFPALWMVIWQAVPYLVVALALLFVAWLLNVIPRFGPRVPSSVPPRRSIIEHVRAAGDFAWRTRSAESLRTSASTAVIHDAERKHPGISRFSKVKQAEAIGRMTGLSAQQVLDALANDDVSNRRAFMHNMQTLQKIRKEL